MGCTHPGYMEVARDEHDRLLAGRCPACGTIAYPVGHPRRNWRWFLRGGWAAMTGDRREEEWAEIVAGAARVERIAA